MSENKKNNKKKNKSNTTEPKQSAIGKLVFERLQKIEAEKAKIKALEDEEERKRIEEELKIEAEKKRIEEEKELKKKKKQDKILEKKKEGTYLTKSQKDKLKKNKSKYEQLISLNNVIVNDNNITILNDISKNNKEDIEEDIEVEEIEEKEENNFRSIITCIMGHVDTGKTKLLDKIRGTNVQDSEAGGITQQIGATFIPINSIFENINDLKLYVPGLLMIDTPGHEAFKNLRTKGSSLCDISIIVVDIVHGLEPQTIESINILIKSDIKFIIALNKIDRLYNWKKDIYKPIQLLLEEQDENCKSEFNSRLEKIIVQIMELGLNAKLFWNNDSVDDTVSICPISAITGQGINELLN
jgi:small GTP-binding protein